MTRDKWSESESWDEELAQGSALILEQRAATADQMRLRAALVALAGVKEGETVVEVGCGTGPLLLDLARAVGPAGRVIGIEPQPYLAALARAKLARAGCAERAEVRAGRAEALALPDASADVCVAQTVLLHLPAPAGRHALDEMARVTRPGGRVLTLDQDVGTLVVDHPDQELTGRILQANLRQYAQPWRGRQARGQALAAGLRDVQVHVIVQAETDPAGYLAGLVERVARSAAEIEAIAADEVDRWLRQLRDLAETDRFFASLNYYACIGRKPL